MESIDKSRLIEHTHRYNKLNLSSAYTSSNTTGKLRFTIPPLNSSGFAYPSKNECLIKIRKVYLGDGKSQKENPISFVTYTDLTGGASNPVQFPEGMTLNTSIISHTNIFCQTQTGDGFDGISSTAQQPKSMLGCILPPSKYNYFNPASAEPTPAIFVQDGGIIVYEDFSKLEDSGTLCSNPFGTTFEIWLSSRYNYTPQIPYDLKGDQLDETIMLGVELEVMTL